MESPDDDNRDSTSNMRKNNHNSISKGVATSFGFKKRPTTAPSALTTANANAARRLANADLIDTNGNDRSDDETRPLTSNAQPTGRSTPKLPPPKKEGIASQGVSRFGFRQPQTNRMNKVADLNSEPIEFGTVKNPSIHQQSINTVRLQNRYKQNGVGVETTTPCVDNNRNRTGVVKTSIQTNQIGKYTLQTNQLPRPQSVRVMETKTAKTLANNNMKLANTGYRRSSPDDSSKDGSLTEDSGVGSHLGTDFDNSSLSPTSGKCKQRSLEIMLNGNTFNVKDMDDSAEVPMPKLPSVFRETPNSNSVFQNTGVVRERTLEYERQLDKGMRRKISATSSEGFSDDVSCQIDNQVTHNLQIPPYVAQKSFIKSKPSPVKSFLKSRVVDNKGYSSSASSDEHEWAFGGEAMADEVSFSISSSDESRDRDFDSLNSHHRKFDQLGHKISTAIVDSNGMKMVSTKGTGQPTRAEFKAITLTIADSNLEAVVAANDSTNTMLEDETSPIDGLLSFSESEEIAKMKLEIQDCKGLNGRQSPTSPGTPTNASNSLSLSEGKDDFLIDDEIADQPALVFGDKSQHNSETTLVESTPRTRRKKLRNFEGSPLILKDKKGLKGSTVSLDTLSPCESIASDDLMMDYDYSQSSGLDDCDKFDNKHDRTLQLTGEPFASGSIGSIEMEIKNNEQLRDWSSLLNYTNDKNSKSSSRPRFLRSRTCTPNSVSDSPTSLDGKTSNRGRISATSSPLRRLVHHNTSSMGYDSDDSVVKYDRATHAAMKSDIVGVKTLLLKLRRVLNEQTNEDTLLMTETRNPFDSQTNGHFNGFSSDTANSCSETEDDTGKMVELTDLRRQVLFLQGQLEDKDKTVHSLQEQITKMCVDNYLSNSAPPSTIAMDREMCNAATQTDRIRPLSVGPSLSNSSQSESTPGSLVSVTELPRRTRTTARTELSAHKRTPTRERRKFGVSPTFGAATPQSMEGFSNAGGTVTSTYIPRRSDSRTRVAPSHFT